MSDRRASVRLVRARLRSPGMRGSVRWLAATLTAASLFIPSAAHAQADGLVAAYGFEEPSGSTVIDSAGSADTGTLNGATRVAAGRYGAALSFDGNDRVDVADS